MRELGIAEVAGYVPSYRLDDYLTRETATPVGTALAGPDEDAFTLLWEALRSLTGGDADRAAAATSAGAGAAGNTTVGERETAGDLVAGATDGAADAPPLLLRLPAGDLESRAVVAHAVATGVVGTPAAVVPLADDAGLGELCALAARLDGPSVGVLVDHARPALHGPHAGPASAAAAAAVRFGEPALATVTGAASRVALTFDRWRTGPSGIALDPRFVEVALVAAEGSALLADVLKAAGRTTADLAGVVVTCGVPLRPRAWAAQWDVPAVWQAPGTRAGAAAAAALLTAVARLREHGPGSSVAVLELGWGGSAVVLTAADGIANGATDDATHNGGATGDAAAGGTRGSRVVRERAPQTYGLGAAGRLASRDSTGPWTSPAELRREMPSLLGPTGGRCADCGTVAFPRAGVCEACGSFAVDAHPVSRTGTVATHSVDTLFDAPDGSVQMVVVDLDGGGRFFGQAVRDLPRALVVGDRVRLVARRLHTALGLPHYFWKVDLDG